VRDLSIHLLRVTLSLFLSLSLSGNSLFKTGSFRVARRQFISRTCYILVVNCTNLSILSNFVLCKFLPSTLTSTASAASFLTAAPRTHAHALQGWQGMRCVHNSTAKNNINGRKKIKIIHLFKIKSNAFSPFSLALLADPCCCFRVLR
jgi:hypothetical protein